MQGKCIMTHLVQNLLTSGVSKSIYILVAEFEDIDSVPKKFPAIKPTKIPTTMPDCDFLRTASSSKVSP
jgi:hypothetical protein